MAKLNFDGPVVLAILDGIGLAPDGPGNAIAKANTPFLAKITRDYLHTALEASGEAVGLLPGTMGNSEVGHKTIGSGQIIKQGIAYIDDAFVDNSIWQSAAWHDVIQNLKKTNGTLHFAGILSDGGVHSHISHLKQMIGKACKEGVKKIRIHCIFDGRDVPPQSEPKYIDELETFAFRFPTADIKIASGGGRMTTIADRYENDWSMVERGFNMMVHGQSDNVFHSATEAIEAFRQKDPNLQDQYIPDFVVIDGQNQPIGKIQTGDSLIYFDFRADRAIEITEAFTNPDFNHFNRGNYSPGDIFFAGLTEYDADRHIPKNQLILPTPVKNTLHSVLGAYHFSELAISETVKFGHITYYFNGASHEKSLNEDFIEIPSDTRPLNERPWMKATEITDAIIDNLDKYKFIRVNYPNGDMVGHLARINSTRLAIEAMDLQLARLARAVDERGGCLVIVSDHGNAEEILDKDGKPKTAHTTNKVPFIIYDNTTNRDHYQLAAIAQTGLANLAATIAELLGLDAYPLDWQPSLITVL